MQHLPEEIAARLGRPMPWWKLLDNPDLSDAETITREASSFAQKLSKFKIAVVPDPRIDDGGIRGDTTCMAFRVSACVRHVTHDYAPAKKQLERDLAFLMLKGSPSPRELNWVRNRGLEMFRMDGETRDRLLTWLELQLHEPIENAEDVVRAIGADPSIPWRGDQYARYYSLCEADGLITGAEREALKLIKQDNGLAAKRQLSIFEQMMSVDEAAAPPAPAPPPAPPRPVVRKAPKTLALLLDESRIASITSETKAVDGLLGQVFKDEEAQPQAALAAKPLSALKAGWREALGIVAEQGSWDQAALEARWRELGLLPQATHDDLNERALDSFGELLLEGEGQLDVNPGALAALREQA